MAIPEAQLDTWAHQGSVAQSKSTYATIKRALEAPGAGYAVHDCNVFLQGSYGNDTNVYAESDVDVVIQFESTYFRDLSELTQAEKDAYEAARSAATYSYDEFKRDVIAQLRATFGTDVHPGQKAVKIQASGARRSADVLIAAQFRRYYRFQSFSDQRYDEGICFFDASGTRIANYPRQHSENCTTKHQATKSWFKPMVRILKNLRGKLVSDGVIEDGLAPSYYLEGLLYNVPNEKFGGTYENTFVNAINWILGADRSKFVCANEQYYLLRDVPNVTWPPANCEKFLDAAVDLWKQW